MNPVYKLSAVEIRPPTPTSLRRDPLHIDDIEGTRSRRTWKGGEQPRSVNQLDDIAGTRSIIRHVPRKRDFSFTQNDYNDVTRMEPKSKRCTNPLMPEYTGIGNEKIGPVEGSTSMCFGNAPAKNYNNDIMRT